MTNIGPKINTQSSSSQLYMKYEENFNIIDDMVSDAFGINMSYDEFQDFDAEELIRMRKRKKKIICQNRKLLAIKSN